MITEFKAPQTENRNELKNGNDTDGEVQTLSAAPDSLSGKNSLVIICAIVSIVTCCFSVNLATTQYKNSTANLYRFHQQLRMGAQPDPTQSDPTRRIQVPTRNQTVSHLKSIEE